MKKLDISKLSANNENLGEVKLKPKKEEKPKKQRTSLVFNVDDYDYIKELRRVWSFERKVDLTIEDVLSEIIRHFKK